MEGARPGPLPLLMILLTLGFSGSAAIAIEGNDFATDWKSEIDNTDILAVDLGALGALSFGWVHF
jgi:hypothetical protein